MRLTVAGAGASTRPLVIQQTRQETRCAQTRRLPARITSAGPLQLIPPRSRLSSLSSTPLSQLPLLQPQLLQPPSTPAASRRKASTMSKRAYDMLGDVRAGDNDDRMQVDEQELVCTLTCRAVYFTDRSRHHRQQLPSRQCQANSQALCITPTANRPPF